MGSDMNIKFYLGTLSPESCNFASHADINTDAEISIICSLSVFSSKRKAYEDEYSMHSVLCSQCLKNKNK